MRFGSDDEGFQGGACGVQSFFLKDFCQAYGVAGNGMQGGGFEIVDEFYLPFAVACGGWYGECSQTFGSVLESEATGKHTVTGTVLKYIRFADAYHVEATGNEVCPGVEVVL